MKAVKILKKIYKNNPDIRSQRNNVDINFTIHNFNDINEAIEELEDLQNRNCGNCKQFAKYKNQNFGDYFGMAKELSDIDIVNKDFYYNRWENKQ